MIFYRFLTSLFLISLLTSACTPTPTDLPASATIGPTAAETPTPVPSSTPEKILDEALPLDIASVPQKGLLAVAGDAGVFVYQVPDDVGEAALLWSAAIPGGARKLAFSPEGGLLAAAGRDMLTLWDVESGQARFTLPLPDQAPGETVDPFDASLTALAISPDEKTLATVNGQGEIVLRDASSGRWLATIPTGTGSDPTGLAFYPDGRYLVSATGHFLFVWDLVENRRLWASQPQLGSWFQYSYSVAVSPDGSTLVNAGDSVMLWNAGSGELLRHFEGISASSAVFSTDGTTIALATYDGLWLVDASSGVQTAALLGGRSLNKAVYVRDGILAALDFANQVTRIDLGQGGSTTALEIDASADLKELSISTDPQTRRPAPTAAPEATLPEFTPHQITVEYLQTDPNNLQLDLAFTPDGELRIATDIGVVTAPTDPDNSPTEDLRWETPPNRVFLSPDGMKAGTLRFKSEGTEAAIWDVPSGSLLRTIVSPFVDGYGSVGFSADGKRLAVKTGEDIFEVQETVSGATLFRWQDPSNQYVNYEHIVFSPDGNQLSAGIRGSFSLWDLKKDKHFTTTGGCRSDVIFDQAYSTGGEWLAVLCAPQDTDLGFFVLLSMEDNQVVQFWDEVGQLQSAAFSTDGRLLAMGTKIGEILFFDMQAKNPAGNPAVKHVGGLKIPTGPVFRLVFSPDGKYMASGSRDGQVILWEIGE